MATTKYHFLTGKVAKSFDLENDEAAVNKAKALQAEFDKKPEAERVTIIRVQNASTGKHVYENVPKVEAHKAEGWEG
jgi:hypothetical protein